LACHTSRPLLATLNFPLSNHTYLNPFNPKTKKSNRNQTGSNRKMNVLTQPDSPAPHASRLIHQAVSSPIKPSLKIQNSKFHVLSGKSAKKWQRHGPKNLQILCKNRQPGGAEKSLKMTFPGSRNEKIMTPSSP